MSLQKNTAVIVVDIQADFTEYRNGSLAVPGTGKDYIDQVVARTGEYSKEGLPIFVTRDYHAIDHISFCTSHTDANPFDVISIGGNQQVLWPPHCVENTPGAEVLVPDDLISKVISKGDHRDQESYSAFRDDSGRETGLKDLLQEMGITNLIIFGLATDYCVRYTALHALEHGYSVTVLLSWSRGVTPEGTLSAVKEMRERGALIVD